MIPAIVLRKNKPIILKLPTLHAMSRWITRDDFVDVYHKLRQRGSTFLLKKLNPSGKSRTLSAFDDTAFDAANWWIVPAVQRRWCELITGKPDYLYEDYLVDKYCGDRGPLKILSIGSGMCSHELRLASRREVSEVVCVDIASNLLDRAREKADAVQGPKMSFLVDDIYTMDLPSGHYDVVLFHASLHHFKGIKALLKDKVAPALTSAGLLVINEYVGPDRLQLPSYQIRAINEALAIIPKAMRQRFKSTAIKDSFNGSGLLRMILADPSECVESASILPVVHRLFDVVEERPYGGNLLMHVLKDIAHHFVDDEDTDARDVLQRLFALEDEYLQEYKSDFYFGVYRKR